MFLRNRRLSLGIGCATLFVFAFLVAGCSWDELAQDSLPDVAYKPKINATPVVEPDVTVVPSVSPSAMTDSPSAMVEETATNAPTVDDNEKSAFEAEPSIEPTNAVESPAVPYSPPITTLNRATPEVTPTPETSPTPTPSVKPETNADGMSLVPDFTLNALDGGQMSLSDFAGKVVVLNFWASWCPPCKQEMPEFDELHGEFEAAGDAVLLTINLTDGMRETKEIARKFIQDSGYEFRVLLDERGVLANMFGVSSIPMTVVIDKEGYAVDGVVGATTKARVLKMMERYR